MIDPTATATSALPGSVEIGSFSVDRDLIIRAWDAWLVRATGIVAAGARGQPLAVVLPDAERRGLRSLVEQVLATGVAAVMPPTGEAPLIPSASPADQRHFDQMQQRVTLAPIWEGETVVGVMATVEDVTRERERERELACQLASTDVRARLRAAEVLAHDDRLGADATLAAALGDDDWRVRRHAIEGLTRRNDCALLASVLTALRTRHTDLNVVSTALNVLTTNGIDVIEPLIAFLDAPDPNLRVQGAMVLGTRQDARATTALMRALGDPDSNVRFHVIEALGRLRARDAVEALATVAESRDFFLAFPALDALARIGDVRIASRLVPLLDDDLLAPAAADALGYVGDEASVRPLVEALGRADGPADGIVRALALLHDRHQSRSRDDRSVADLLRRSITPAGLRNLTEAVERPGFDGRALAVVLGWLDQSDARAPLVQLLARAHAREAAVESLVGFGSAVTDVLIEQLRADDLEIRKAAIAALKGLRDRRATPVLLSLLDDEPDVVVAAAGALAVLGDPAAFEPLVGLLAHDHAAVRQAAISALQWFQQPEHSGRIAELTGDRDPRVREGAVRLAGHLSDPAGQELLFERCQDTDETVRRAAVEMLPYVQDDRVAPILLDALRAGTPRVRAAAAHALGSIQHSDAIPALVRALEDPDSWVRYFATRALGRHAAVEAVDELTRLVVTDTARHVTIAAVESLGRVGGLSAMAVLTRCAESSDRDLARAALQALALMHEPTAERALEAALDNRDVERRLDAVDAFTAAALSGAVEHLRRVAATDPDPRVAHAAVDGLCRLAGGSRSDSLAAVDALMSLAAEVVRGEQYLDALTSLEGEAMDRVVEGLTNTTVAVRRAVVEALVRSGRQLEAHRAESQLRLLAHHDPDPDVRRAAAAVLRNLSRPATA